ncbi:MAG TPA: phospholipase [Chloroflexota bacterium]|nr:phospholipase [Chloroflexota bacterium]
MHHHHHHAVERVRTEPVVLDIGGDIGALLILTEPTDVGREIEMSRKGQSGRFHNQVHERTFNGRTVCAAVYPDLREGEYDVWADETTLAGSITIRGGEVSSLDWRSRA